MILRSISLTNFKNIADARLEFSPNVNCFLGDNGMGKSNLLDSLYFLSFCKSFSGVQDGMLVRRGEDFAMVRGNYFRRGLEEELSATLRQGKRKTFRRGGKEYQRLSEHIGAFPLVMLSPADFNLVGGTSEDRRRFLDQIVSQNDQRYFDALLRYNSALDQRNRLLKDESADKALFAAIETQMDMTAAYITRRRRETTDTLSVIFARYYGQISGGGETVDLSYQSRMDESGESLMTIMERNRQRDEILHHTSSGPHRDDIDMTLDGMPARRCASQGQIKTFTCALRFAQYELMKDAIGFGPLLLLDDIFDKLDSNRVGRIMSIVATPGVFGQIFITDTNRKHLDEIIADLPHAEGTDGYRLWHVASGEFTPLNSRDNETT